MRRFTFKDMDALNRWYSARQLPMVPWRALPELGFIVDDVAAGFLYRTDAPELAFLDGFVTNPAAPLRARRHAVQELVEELCNAAYVHGVGCVAGMTEHRSLARLVQRHGFRPIGLYEMLRKEL
jgi:hypothetical protein